MQKCFVASEKNDLTESSDDEDFPLSRYWAKHRPSSTEDDSDDEIVSSGAQSISYKAGYERQLKIIKQLKLGNKLIHDQKNEIEIKLKDRIKRLETEKSLFESQAEEYESDLRHQKIMLRSMEERYNSLLSSLSSITVTFTSGRLEWKDRNLSGCYHFAEIVNNRPSYKVRFCDLKRNTAIIVVYKLSYLAPK